MQFSQKYYPRVNDGKKKGNTTSAILLGWNNNSIDMLNSLQKKNVSVSIIYSKDKFSSKLGNNNYQNEAVNKVSENLVNYLNQEVKPSVTSVVISSDDTYTILLAFAKVRLEDRFIYENLDQSIVTKCANKIEFDILCREQSINSPTTFVIKNKEDLHQIKPKLTFPGIVKPQYPGAVSKKIIPKVLKINDFDELNVLSEKIFPTAVPLFFQELIPGGSDCIFFVGGYFSRNEADNLLFIGRKSLEMPVLGGSTTYATLEWNQIVLNAAKKIVKSIDYQGLADIEFKYDYRDGKYKIIEVNPRIGRWHLISSIDNWDIISAYFFKFSEQSFPNINFHTEGQSWISPHLSLCGFIETKGIFLGAIRWLVALKRSKVKVDINIRDLNKTLHQLRVVLGHIRSIGLRKFLLGS